MAELRVDRLRRTAAVVLGGLTAAALAAALVDLPGDRAPIPAIARTAVDGAINTWHTPETVNAIVYGWRATDTFGETFLLLAAVIAVAVITRRRERRRVYLQEERLAQHEQEREGEHAHAMSSAERAEQGEGNERADDDDGSIGRRERVRSQPMTIVVRGAALAVLPVVAVAGVEIAVLGFTPGGGFPAGAVLTGVTLLAYVAFGYGAVRRVVNPPVLEVGELAGAFLIVALGVAGLVAKGHFFANSLPLAGTGTIFGGGLLQAFSISELVEVSTGLAIVIFSILAMENEWAGQDDEGGQ
jgi:multicomponent Na+:H+ antiporter subunit B